MKPHPVSPDDWHPGEKAVQTRAGVDQRMATLAPRIFLRQMPEQHRDFFQQLPMVFMGAEDTHQNLWASALFGEPGFLNSPAADRILINTRFNPSDPLATSLSTGDPVGLLGIELETRRRNRLNARVESISEQQISLSVQQSFGNCPKYIQRRSKTPNPSYGQFHALDLTSLDRAAKALITTADTCFIASAFNDGEHNRNRGTDVSHRGGNPGFIKLDHRDRLLIPDYAGNNFFNTLGNLHMDPRCGLLIPDFVNGHLLLLTGHAEIIWREQSPLPFDAVPRMLCIEMKQGRWLSNALPYISNLTEPSPYNPKL